MKPRPPSILGVSALAVLVPLLSSPAGAQQAGEPAALREGAHVPRPKPRSLAQVQIERGKYLVTIGGCNDCHTPMKMGPKGPEPDMSRMLSGHPQDLKLPPPPVLPPGPWAVTIAPLTAWSGPWGISYTANLTPDQLTGLGIWTEDIFMKAIRTGKHMGTSRPILPPMPWEMYRNMTDADLKAVFAYLRSIPPVKNLVPDPVPPRAAPGEATPDKPEPAKK